MAKTKVRITTHNIFNFLLYFENGVVKTERVAKKIDLDKRSTACREFKEILDAYYRIDRNQREAFPAKLQGWVDRYLSKEAWDRCLAAFRQAKFHRDNKRFVVKLRVEAYVELESYAKAINLPLGEAVYQAVKRENQRLSEERC